VHFHIPTAQAVGYGITSLWDFDHHNNRTPPICSG